MLIFVFCLSAAALFLQSVCLSGIPMNAFAPWIAFVTLRVSLQEDFWRPLWLSAAAGILVDLLSAHPLGLHPIAYSLTSFLLFRFRNRFFYDRPLHLALFAMLVSCNSSLFQIFFLFLFDRGISTDGKWIAADWIGTSLIDGIYALIWFSGPLYLWAKTKRIWMLFRLKKAAF